MNIKEKKSIKNIAKILSEDIVSKRISKVQDVIMEWEFAKITSLEALAVIRKLVKEDKLKGGRN